MSNVKDYVYCVWKGKIYRLHIELDEEPWNPRVDMDGNIGTMFCLHSRYRLGDKTDYSDVDGCKRAILSELGITMKQIGRYLKKHGSIDLKYDRSLREWQVWGKCYSSDLKKETYGIVDSAKIVGFLEDTIIEYLSIQDIKHLANGNLFSLPLYLLDHSGITMNASGFQDCWDSGQVGIIWTTAEKAIEAFGISGKITRKELEERVLKDLNAEVEQYDSYLRGDCWGYIEEVLLPNGIWKEEDSCWGYYCDSVSPLNEIASEVYGQDMLSEMPATA